MARVLDELGLSRLADIPGLSAVGAAAILAETGDPRRYDSSSSLVKHAGLSPSDNASGAFDGACAHLPPRPARACGWPSGARSGRCSSYNPVMAAKYQAMTQAAGDRRRARRRRHRGRPARRPAAARARRAKARVACAASLLRWIYCLVVHGTSWDPAVASGAASLHDAPHSQAEAA